MFRKRSIILMVFAMLGSTLFFHVNSANASSLKTGYPGGHWKPEPATYGIVKESNVPIKMSDGTVLMADVYRPANPETGLPADQKFPVILAQTPYKKSGALTNAGDGYYPYLIKRGYINVIVDVRGTGSSEGTWQFFGKRERQDGVELVNWCAHHLFGSNGIVGLAGASYLGINQLYTAALVGKNSPLKAIFPVIAGTDLYRDTAFQGGIPDVEFSAPWLGLRALLDIQPSDNTLNDPEESLEVELQHTGRLVSFYVPFLTSVETGGSKAYDEAFWRNRAPRHFLKRIVENGIPAFLVGGWFDLFQRGEPLNYAGLQNAYFGRPVTAPMTASQPVTGRYQLVMGPWYHLTATLGQRLKELRLEWFDTWLKGKNTGMAKTKTPLHLYELQKQQWVNTATYPLSETEVKTYYFHGGNTGTAQSINDGYLLAAKPNTLLTADTLPWMATSSPLSRQTDQWIMGAPSLAAKELGLPPIPFTQDDRTLSTTGLTYTTKPLENGKVLAGPIDVTLFATSTTTNTEFVATVEDVKPDGQSYPLTSGALIGGLRAVNQQASWYQDGKLVMPQHPFTKESRQLVTPRKVTRYDIQVFPTFAYIAPGDRIRITITPSDTPHLAPNATQLPGLVGGVYNILRTQRYASFVNLPLASPDAFTKSDIVWGQSGF
ncbi:MAG TPA: CocE/NonD family hydrolase [Bacillales bacterium]|nr:CocE/NonD family hydrolase [Bacillales bacterium]